MKTDKLGLQYLIGILLSLGSLGAVFGAPPLQIEAARIEVKANGVLIHLSVSEPTHIENITGWIQGTEWFYMTIMDAVSDTVVIGSARLLLPVTKIQAINLPQSTQIALQLERTIDHFELYQSSNPPEILISLRYPVSEVLAMLDTISKEQTGPTPEPTLYPKIRTALYLVGTTLTISGILLQEGDSERSSTLLLGVGLLVGTYLYDTYIRPGRDYGETLTILRSIFRSRATSNGPFLPAEIPS